MAVSTDAASNGASDVVTITGAKLNANKPDSAVARLLANPVVISVICGIVLFTASTLQQYGILYGKSAGRAGFLTAMYIVMVPLLAFVFLRRRIGMLVFVAVALSIAGFYLLCITDGFGSIGLADILLVFTAVLFAVQPVMETSRKRIVAGGSGGKAASKPESKRASEEEEEEESGKGIKERGKAARFRAPSPAEVAEYAQQFAADKGLDLTALDFDPERFVDFYAQKGWMVGRSHMKDWKATVRNWVRTSKPKNGMAKEVPDDGFSAYD